MRHDRADQLMTRLVTTSVEERADQACDAVTALLSGERPSVPEPVGRGAGNPDALAAVANLIQGRE